MTHKIVEVKWEDSTSLHGWRSREDVERFLVEGSSTCKTSGYLLEKSNKHIAIVQSFGYANGSNLPDNYGEIMIIPRKCIKSIVELEGKK